MIKKFVYVIIIFFMFTVKVFSADVNTNTTWSGEILISEQVKVQKGVILTILPGTIIKFNSYEAGLNVEGLLIANGNYEQKITFTSMDENDTTNKWRGITLYGSNREGGIPNQLTNCIVKGANTGISCVQATVVEIKNCIFRENSKGVLFSQSCIGIVRNSEFTENTDNGITYQLSEGEVKNCKFKDNKNYAVACTNGCEVLIEENLFEKNFYGIICALSETKVTVKNNIIRDNELGIFVERTANAKILNNTLQKNDYGIYLERGPRVIITMNEITENRIGVFIRQDFDSIVNENNIYNNKEYEIGLKEVSGEYMRKLKSGVKIKDDTTEVFPCMRSNNSSAENTFYSDYFDAKRNFWGEDVTKEMKEKGLQANISKIMDFYDNPIENISGKDYRQNYILFSDWKEIKIQEAGAKSGSSYGIENIPQAGIPDIIPADTTNQPPVQK